MKAHRAIVELGLLGALYLVAGIVAVSHDGVPAFGRLAAVLGVLVTGGVIWLIAMAFYRLREIEGLPETAKRVSWPAVAARVSLASVPQVATLVLLSTTSPGGAWLLGLAYAVIGGALFATAVLASHVEHLCGARVWRSSNRFYFAR